MYSLCEILRSEILSFEILSSENLETKICPLMPHR